MANKLPFISIIIPVYGVETYIEDCLLSVMRQDYTGPVECILVDDCGPDDSMAIATSVIGRYEGAIDFRVVRHEQNKGLSGARNTGLKHVRGEYAFFLDSDDEISPNCLSVLAQPLLSKPYQVVCGDLSVVGSSASWPLLAEGEINGNERVIATFLEHAWVQIAPNKLYDVSFLREHDITFLEGVIHEDELWSCMIASCASLMYAVQSKTYVYKIRENSITTGNKLARRLDSFYKMISAFKQYMQSHKLWSKVETNDLLQYLFGTMMWIVLANDADSYASVYRKSRALIHASYGHFLLTNGSRVKHQIRDLHYLFPSRLGAKVYRAYISGPLPTSPKGE